MGNANLDHSSNAQLDDYTYDIPLLETIHFNTISIKGNFKLLQLHPSWARIHRQFNNILMEVQNQERKNRPVSQSSSLVLIRNTKHRNGYSIIEITNNLLLEYVTITSNFQCKSKSMHPYYLLLRKQNCSTVLKRCFGDGYHFCLEILISLQPDQKKKNVTMSQI